MMLFATTTVFAAVLVSPELFTDLPSGNIIYGVNDLKDCPTSINGVVCRKYLIEPPIGIKVYNAKIYNEMIEKYKTDIKTQISEENAVMTVYEFKHKKRSVAGEIAGMVGNIAVVAAPIVAPVGAAVKTGMAIGLQGKSTGGIDDTLKKDDLESSFEIRYYPDGKRIQADCDNLPSDACRAKFLDVLKERAAKLK